MIKPSIVEAFTQSTLTAGSAAVPAEIDGNRLQVVESVDHTVWAQNGFDIARSSAQRLQKTVLSTIELITEDRRAEAARYLPICLEGLERFADALTHTRLSLSLDFTLMKTDGYTLAQLEQTLGNLIKGIRRCHENDDWAGLTEQIEYGLLTNLHAWNQALVELCRSHQSNA